MAADRQPETEGPAGVRIRRYAPADRAAVRRLALDCADRRVVPACLGRRTAWAADVLTAYYTDYEPESSIVAVDSDGAVVGYLFGCRSTPRRDWIVGTRILPRVVARSILTGAVFRCPVGRLLTSAWRSRGTARAALRALDRTFPAHLHIGLREDARGRGLGGRMLSGFLDALRDAGVAGVHVSAVATNRPAEALFRGAGFRTLGRYEVFFVGSPSPVAMLLLGQRMDDGRANSASRPSKA